MNFQLLAFVLLGIASAQYFDGSKAYLIRAKHSNLYLTSSSQTAGVSDIVQFLLAEDKRLQHFYFKLKPGTSNRYFIHSYFNPANVLDVKGAAVADLAGVQLYPKHGGDNQLFEITQNADFSYKIKAVHSGKFLDVYGVSPNLGATLIQYPSTVGDNQKFFIESY